MVGWLVICYLWDCEAVVVDEIMLIGDHCYLLLVVCYCYQVLKQAYRLNKFKVFGGCMPSWVSHELYQPKTARPPPFTFYVPMIISYCLNRTCVHGLSGSGLVTNCENV